MTPALAGCGAARLSRLGRDREDVQKADTEGGGGRYARGESWVVAVQWFVCEGSEERGGPLGATMTRVSVALLACQITTSPCHAHDHDNVLASAMQRDLPQDVKRNKRKATVPSKKRRRKHKLRITIKKTKTKTQNTTPQPARSSECRYAEPWPMLTAFESGMTGGLESGPCRDTASYCSKRPPSCASQLGTYTSDGGVLCTMQRE